MNEKQLGNLDSLYVVRIKKEQQMTDTTETFRGTTMTHQRLLEIVGPVLGIPYAGNLPVLVVFGSPIDGVKAIELVILGIPLISFAECPLEFHLILETGNVIIPQ